MNLSFCFRSVGTALYRHTSVCFVSISKDNQFFQYNKFKGEEHNIEPRLFHLKQPL